MSVNSTSQLTVELPVLNLTMLNLNLGVVFPSLRYRVQMAHVGFYEYNSHFSLYVKTQVALEHYDLFKLHLKDAWLMTNAGEILCIHEVSYEKK